MFRNEEFRYSESRRNVLWEVTLDHKFTRWLPNRTNYATKKRKSTITEDLRLPELYNWRYYISLTYIDRFGTMRENITSSKLNFKLNSTHWKFVSFKRFKNENMHEFAYFVLVMITQRMYACYFEMIVHLPVLFILNYVN